MKKYFVNNEIRERMLNVIDSSGKFLGKMEKNEALKLAFNDNLDLVLINKNSDPPVAKIINYSKFKYELEKKEKDLRKKTRLSKQDMKEVNIRPNTGSWDLERIKKKIEEWLCEGHKVKINMLIKGREKNYKNTAEDLLKNFISTIRNCKIENPIKDSNKGLFTILIKQ